MRFAEAMRLGATMGPQIRQQVYDETTQGTCAVGAALIAAGWLNVVLDHPMPLIEVIRLAIPAMKDDFALDHIFVLNDHSLKTREEIAALIETNPAINCEVFTPSDVWWPATKIITAPLTQKEVLA